MASSDYPRDLAVRALTRVLSDGQALDEALAGLTGEIKPEGRGWLTEVCSGTLRWKGRLDAVIDAIALRKKPSGWLRKTLLVAAYQLIGQERTSPGAVVSETVNLIRQKEGEAPAKFANALLRKISEHAESWRTLEFPADGTPAEAAAWASQPEWLWRRIFRERGSEWAKAYALASLERPSLWVRARGGRPGWEPGPVPGSFRVAASEEGPGVASWQGFEGGQFFVQDISSQWLVHSISQAVREEAPSAPRTALDLCAAPGGKSAGLAWDGWEVTASDRESPRMELLKQTLARVAPQSRVVQKSEVSKLEPMTLVWVDSPCTGSGILRRHPDARWLRQETELAALGRVQVQLLREGWERVAPGGFLAYSVCSVLKEEGPQPLERAGLAGHLVREWRLDPQTPPHGDGFWCALLRKPQ
jgi:16S rRNA (cytosine967-C5)-methyltransferase